MAEVYSKVKIDDRTMEFARQHTEVMDKAVDDMANDALMFSRVLVPRDEGDLSRSGEVVKEGKMQRTVYYGRDGDTSDYAAPQEEGKIRGSIIRNYSTPGTGARFMQRGATKVISNAMNYLKLAASRLR